MGETLARPEGEFETGLKVEERDRAVFEFGADNALRWLAETVAIKGEGRRQIIDA